jgi:hypothetical protein
VLVHPDVREAVAWPTDTFGFRRGRRANGQQARREAGATHVVTVRVDDVGSVVERAPRQRSTARSLLI